MTYQEMRTQLNRIQREEPISPTESELIDILFEMLIALESQSKRIQELALNKLGVPLPK